MHNLPDSVTATIKELTDKFLKARQPRDKRDVEPVHNDKTSLIKSMIADENPEFAGLAEELSKYFSPKSRLRFMFFNKTGSVMVYAIIGGSPIHIGSIHDWLGLLCLNLHRPEFNVSLFPAISEAAVCSFFSEIDSYLISLFGENSECDSRLPSEEVLEKIFPIPAAVTNAAISALRASHEACYQRRSPPAHTPIFTHNGANVYDCRPRAELGERGDESGLKEILIPYGPDDNHSNFILGVGLKISPAQWRVFFLAPDGSPNGWLLRDANVEADIITPLCPEQNFSLRHMPASGTLN